MVQVPNTIHNVLMPIKPPAYAAKLIPNLCATL